MKQGSEPLRRLLATAVTLWVAGALLPAVTAEETTEKTLVSAGERPDAVLMYTGDVIGYLEDCGCKKNPAGGLARRAWVIKQVKNRFPGVPMLLLDSGNFSDNPTPEGDRQTHTLLQAMAQLGYEIVNIGERDIRLGYDEFRERTKDAPFHFISANIVKKGTGEPIFEPHAVVELGGAGSQPKVKVGVIGVARYNPIFLKAGPDGSNMVIAHHVESVKTQLQALQAKKVDVVVLLAALHLHDAKEIAEQVPGIDYVFGAYGGMSSEEDVGQTSVLYCGNRGQRIAEARVRLPAAGQDQAISAIDTLRMHFLTAEYPESSEMRRFLETMATQVGEAGVAADGAPR